MLNQMDDLSDKVAKQQRGLQSMADGLTNVGQKLTLGITTPLAALGVVAYNTSANFEKTMNQVGVATNSAGGEMDQLKKLAVDMGNATVFSANDAADAMLELAKGGLTAAQIQAGALQATLTLATAGGLQLGDAAGYMSNALNMFGLDASKSTEVAAALAGGANASTASVESMGLALSQVGPSAKLAGLSLQDTTAVLAAFDNAGVKGQDAGTSLKMMLLNLIPTTDKQKEAMQKLGLSFVDAQGKILPIRDIAQQLQDKLSGLSQSQKQVALETIFGTDAFRAAAILMDQGSAGVDKYVAATSDQTQADKMAAATMEGKSGSIERLKGSMETFSKTLGDVIGPVVTSIIEKVTGLINKFSEMSPTAQKVVVIVGLLAAAIGPLLLFLGLMANAIIGISTAMAIMNISLGPLLIVVGIIAALAALAILVIKNWDSVKSFFLGVWDAIKKAFATAIDWIKEHWELLLVIMLGPFGLFIAEVIKHWDDIKNFVMGVFSAIADAAQAAWNFISDVTYAVWNFIYNGIISPIVNLIVGLFNVWLAVVTYIFDVIRGLALVVWWEIHDKIIAPVVGKLVDLFNFFQGVVTAVWDAIRDAALVAWNWIYDKIISPVINQLVGAFNFYKDIALGVWDVIKSVGSSVWGAIAGGFSWAWGQVTAIWNAAAGFFGSVWNNVVSSASSIAGGLANAFTSAFEGAKNIAKGAVNWMIDKINSVIKGVNNSAGKLPGVPDIPQIPKLAQGIANFAGGLATVGEMGRETVWLPPGASVFSSADSSRMASAGGGSELHIHLDGANITSPHVASDYAEIIGDAIIEKLRGNARI